MRRKPQRRRTCWGAKRPAQGPGTSGWARRRRKRSRCRGCSEGGRGACGRGGCGRGPRCTLQGVAVRAVVGERLWRRGRSAGGRGACGRVPRRHVARGRSARGRGRAVVGERSQRHGHGVNDQGASDRSAGSRGAAHEIATRGPAHSPSVRGTAHRRAGVRGPAHDAVAPGPAPPGRHRHRRPGAGIRSGRAADRLGDHGPEDRALRRRRNARSGSKAPRARSCAWIPRWRGS